MLPPPRGAISVAAATMEDDRFEKSSQVKSGSTSSPDSSIGGVLEPSYYGDEVDPRSVPQRVWDSFKRDPTLYATPKGVVGSNGRVFDAEMAAHRTADSPLARKLKGRHLQMIAIGGSIGTGLFVASGKALAQGGPASLLIAYTLIGTMLYCTVHALGEMAVLFPVAGSFSAYSTRFLDPAWGFTMVSTCRSVRFPSQRC